MKKKQNLKNNLRLGVAGLAVTCVLFTAIVVASINWQKFWQLHTDKQVYFTYYSTSQINSWLDEHFRKVLFISQVTDLVNHNHQYRENLLNSVIESNSAIEDIVIIDTNNRIVDGQNQAFDSQYSYIVDEEALQNVLTTGREYIDICKYTSDNQDTHLTIIYPLRDGTGHINGSLKARLNLAYLKFIVSNLRFGRTGYAYVLAPQNRIVVHNSRLKQAQVDNVRLQHGYLELLRKTEISGIHKGLTGDRVSASHERIKDLNWFLVVELPLREVAQNMHRLLILVILTGSMSILLAYAVSRVFYNKVARSLDSLSTAAQKVSQGKLDTEIDHISQDELGEVATAFNTMTYRLRTHFNEVEKKLRFEQILAQITSGVIELGDAQGKLSINKIQELCASYLGASRSVVFLYEESQDTFTGSYQWYLNPRMDRVKSERITYDSSAFPYFIPVLRMNYIVCLGVADGEKTMLELMPDITGNLSEPDLKCKDTELYKYIIKNNLVYMIGLPIFDGDKFLGKISFGFEKFPADIDSWRENNLKILKNVISSSLVSIQQRRHLVEEHERLLTTLYSIGDAVITTDETGRINMMNPIAENLTGWSQSEACGKAMEEVFSVLHPSTRIPLDNPVHNVLKLRQRTELIPNSILVARDGSEYIVSDSAAPITDTHDNIVGIVLVFRDETEKFSMQMEKLKLQRLEAVSLLAAGIAHDFNNLLTAIMGNLSLAKDLVPHYSDAAKIISLAENSAEKGQDITNQLLVYAKGGVPEARISNITKLIRETTQFLLKGSKVRCNIEVEPGLHSIHMAEGIFNQILTNIILNAKHAIDGKGDLSIVAQNVNVDEHFNLPIKNGTYVLITVSDNGAGIAPEDLPRIFDPYFSTKNTGSGLGLTSVLALLKKHEGFITINSKQNEGTQVNLYFPSTSESQEYPQIHPQKDEAYRVLCFESDEFLQNMIKKSLSHLDLDLIFTSSMVDLMEWFKISGIGKKSFNCVFMDVNTLNREYLATVVNELQIINPMVKILVACDYVDETESLIKSGISFVLQKPYQVNILRDVFDSFVLG